MMPLRGKLKMVELLESENNVDLETSFELWTIPMLNNTAPPPTNTLFLWTPTSFRFPFTFCVEKFKWNVVVKLAKNAEYGVFLNFRVSIVYVI